MKHARQTCDATCKTEYRFTASVDFTAEVCFSYFMLCSVRTYADVDTKIDYQCRAVMPLLFHELDGR